MSNGLNWYANTTALTVDFISAVYPDAASESLTAAAPAASVLKYLTVLDATSNGVACTLADGIVHGQMKRFIAKVVSGGATTVTLASPVSSSLDVITFTVIGDTADLQWNAEDGYWRILALTDVDRNISTPTAA